RVRANQAAVRCSLRSASADAEAGAIRVGSLGVRVPSVLSSRWSCRVRVWDPFLSDLDRQVCALSGYGRRVGLGQRPVVLVVDVTFAYCDEKPLPILESVTRSHNSCGEVAWVAIESIERLLAVSRAPALPIAYTRGDEGSAPTELQLGRWRDKGSREGESSGPHDNEIVTSIAPRREDIVIEKSMPSAFFGTMLAAYLTQLEADTL